ncbi:MAG: MFS transporter [Gammaproteobacteria bacterium]|nr:MAG: MFS transporter [Gammaproteobacteria bacterium]RLA36382.1 MAG: MFS transporter [Gammaproteobacteria bacterium]
MTDDGRKLLHHHTEFDDWRSLTIGIYMALTGYTVMVGLPVISSSWVNNLGFSAVEVGRVAGADLGGLAIGAVISAIYVAKVDRRHLVAGAALLAIAANVLCIYYQSYEVTLWLRLAAGIGSGIYTGVAVATIAGHSRPAFAFSLELFAFAGSQGATLKLLPLLSIEGVYVVLIATYVVGLLFISWLPRRPVDKALDVDIDVEESGGQHHTEHKHVPTYVPWMVLTAIVLTYINIGAYWTYIELSTVDSAASPEWVASMLWISSVFSVIGCLFAVLLSNRYGLSRPLLVTLVFQAGIVLMLVFGITNATVAFSMFFFNFCWIFVDIYQAATIANVDHSGRFPAMIPAAQGLGNFLGPNMAATVLAYGFGFDGVFILCAMASIAAMLVYLYMYLMLKKTIPALADAS